MSSLPPRASALHNPWTLLLEPACCGDRIGVQSAYTRLRQDLPPTARPLLVSVLARALAALGLPREARRALDQGLALASPHARVAARAALPDQTHATTRLPGDAADWLCEQADEAVHAEDLGRARSAVEAALQQVPGHAEAKRWQRFLARPTSAERRDLKLTARWGWLSPERWHRRVASGAWCPPARARSGLEQLRAQGVVSRVLGTDADHEAVAAGHPLAEAEAALDAALSLDREGRPAGTAALRAWHCASATDPLAQHDAAGALVALGVRNTDAAATGLLAVKLLQALEPEISLWAAYEARLLAQLEEPGDAQRIATRILRNGPHDPVAFVLCIQALRLSGAPRAARKLAVRALCLDDLQATARLLLHDWNRAGPLLPQVSSRRVSRRLDMEIEEQAG